ncbi:U1 small nuclear ribonucleoprotein C-like [Diospyros lotus]|uniref:U1 small nuclear ribonucleoprotein C-like n=1 Tax=Diospyros lotus TaxID=55363 RepID=UPI002251BE3A|nr:U1 small nuclear ribonucleoprotein C-like [Diospyros lotus]
MPRYYCDTYLTHDSPSVRKQHNAGYKHKANVRSYYQQFGEEQTQSLIHQRIKEHLGQTSVYHQQVGAAYNKHLASLPGNPQRPRLPVLPLPVLPIPGVAPPPLVPGVRPPMLPRPGALGYGMAAPPVAPVMGQPPTASSLPVPLTLNGPETVPGGVAAPGSNAAPSAVSQPMYQPTAGTSSSSTAASS